jgi:ABC-type cobalamin/Fe3+-siderophores transport system ATPase subunit
MATEIVFEGVSFRYPETDRDVFTNLDISLPAGIVSLVGQNGTGKSTLLLLASGRLLPTEGRVLIRGIDTRSLADEEARQALVSFIYQNMEFETRQPIGELLRFVYENGLRGSAARSGTDGDPVPELVEAFELGPILGRRTQEVSKGELQRTILAFSLLYGSPLLAMDEPIFALEERQKIAAMEFLTRRARAGGVSLYYSLHELDLSEKYSDFIVLFSRDGKPRVGPTREVFTRETIEQAYEVPFAMLKRREELYRRYLLELLKIKGKE